MERSMKRKVTKIIQFENQPIRKIPRISLSPEKSTSGYHHNRSDADENIIVRSMQKMTISYEYEFYLDSPLREDDSSLNEKNNDNEGAVAGTSNNLNKNEWGNISFLNESSDSHATDNDTSVSSTLSASEGGCTANDTTVSADEGDSSFNFSDLSVDYDSMDSSYDSGSDSSDC